MVRLLNGVAHPKQKDAKRCTITEWAETGFAATGMLHLAMLWWLGYDERVPPSRPLRCLRHLVADVIAQTMTKSMYG